MLTDIFAHRYMNVVLWDRFDENARRLLVQSFRIISEQLFPYYSYDGKENPKMKETWEQLNKQLAMELGLKDLSTPTYGYYSQWNGNKHWTSGSLAKVTVCENFVCSDFDGTIAADQFIKERLSFIEIAFRCRTEQIATMNAGLEKNVHEAEISSKRRAHRGVVRVSDNPSDRLRAANAAMNNQFQASCDELNARFRQARTRLDYHNGFIQISSDETMTDQIEKTFWNLVSAPEWRNVDNDIKEAIDLRDNGGRDPAWYAAKALESTIKIISNEKGWTQGNERGASNFVDNLRSKKNGEFISGWECDDIKSFFRNVRNPFGHGAGDDNMPKLSLAQTDWAIEFCMIWIKNLIRRM
ncbi:AbiJ-NTD4 domain-containing protein [Amphritea sp. HPY]|uniref:AbiJ-NTD4 domain-containing protein n=1 Tax=Amphritea sp. HPY TaxID=3421652 RepID=UPI003D7D1928